MPAAPLKLVTATGQPATSGVQEVPATGLTLTLKVPEVAPAHLELTQAELTLSAPTGTTNLSGGGTGLVVATNLGPLSQGWTSEKANDVTWITADWGERRSLVSITVSSTVANDPNVARLKVSDGGVWFPPLPVETVPFNREQALPDIVASRLMIEVVRPDAGGVLKPATGRLAGLTVKLAAQPFDVSVRVGRQPPVLERAGRLLPGEQVRVVEGLREALQQQVPGDGRAADVPVVIQAAVPGRVTVPAAQFSAQTVYTALDGGPAPLWLDWGGEALGRLTVGEGALLSELSFTLEPELTPERIRVEGRLQEASSYGQWCDGGHVAAQGFPGLGDGALTGVDLVLRPKTGRVVGTLALHPDASGRPADEPYVGARVPISVEAQGAPPWKARWVSVQLPRPVRLAERWWLVLTVSEGEALWPLSAVVPGVEGGLGPVLWRVTEGAWFPWEAPPAQAWALSRLRGASGEGPPPFEVELRRGNAKKKVTPDMSGRVEVPAAVLSGLGKVGAAVEIAVKSAGPSVAGSLHLRALRVAARATG